MSSSIGERVKVTLFGQSHGEAVGVVVDGLPAGEPVDMAWLQAFLDRRAPGRDVFSSARQERDVPRVLSGLVAGVTCGAPLCAVIDNEDARSEVYATLRDLPRPGHADYPAHARYRGHADLRGGGHLSGRLTAPLCLAGGIALQLLTRRGIAVGAHALAIGGVQDRAFDAVCPPPAELSGPGEKAFPVLDDAAGERMCDAIAAAKADGDSLGGIVECCVTGLPIGLGSPIFGGVESRLSQMLFGIPAVRGVSFGAGFEAAGMTGSQHNDPYVLQDGKIVTETNRHGGVLGGITTGMPLRVQVAFKPTPSVSIPQRTVRLSTMAEEMVTTSGRHDPCIVPRAVPCVEAAVALTLLDLLLEGSV